MDSGDRSLELIRTHRRSRERGADQLGALGNSLHVPQRAVLIRQRNQLALSSSPGRTPSIGEQHQRQQTGNLTFGRQLVTQLPSEPDSLRTELNPMQSLTRRRGVALVEDQIEHMQYGAQPRGQLISRRQREPGTLQFRLRPADPLPDSCLRHQKRPGDLTGGQPADRPQRERDLRLRGQIRMAAQHQQRQRVVDRGRRLRLRLPTFRLLAPPPGRLTPQYLDPPPRGDRDQPTARILRYAVARPLHRRRQQRLLHGVLARVELAVPADQRAQDDRRLRAQHLLHHMYADKSRTGRTSTTLYGASGISATISAARSIDSQSSR